MRRIKNLLKKGTSLMLVFAMLMGLCSTGFAADGTSSSHGVAEGAKKYVSLGDSMTNGYGLTGYETEELEVNGYLMHAMDSYACQFADKYGFEHIPMAISAMRAEDLHFVLEYPWENETSEMKKVVEGGNEWDKEGWEALFSTGDYYTWREFTNDPTGTGRDGRFFDYPGKNTAVVAEEMQTAVANADIISLGIGNANFGVFLLGRVFEAMSILDGDPAETEWYQLERALAECDEETRAFILDIYDELSAKIGDTEQAQTLARVLTYGALSYVLNYAGIIERIVELNPDAEIMLVGLINTMYGMKITGDFGEIDLGEILGSMIGTMNTYIAALPAAFQLAGKYEGATFYYAEASNVELIYTELAAAAEVNFEGYEIVRDRIVEEVNDMMFGADGLLNGFAVSANAELGGKKVTATMAIEEITLADVKAYENGEALSANKTFTVALYLAFEQAVIEASKMETLDINALETLTSGLEGALGGVMGSLDPTALVTEEARNAIIAEVFAKYGAWLGTEEGDKAYMECYEAAMNSVKTKIEEATQEFVDAGTYNDAVKTALGTAVATAEVSIKEGIDALKNILYGKVYSGAYPLSDDLKNWSISYTEDRINVEWSDLYASLTTSASKNEAYALYGAATAKVVSDINASFATLRAELEKLNAEVHDKAPASVYSDFVPALENLYASIPTAEALCDTVWNVLWDGNPEAELTFEDLYEQAYTRYTTALAEAENLLVGTNFEGAPIAISNAKMLPLANGFVDSELNDWASEAAAEALGATLTTTVSGALVKDETVMGLLHLFARMMIGNGIGAHPTATGHDALADAVIKAYDEKNTVDKETINRILATLNDVATIIAENYEEAYAEGHKYAVENGYIQIALDALDVAETELNNIAALVAGAEMSDAFRAELAIEIATAHKTIAALRDLVKAPTHAEAVTEAADLLVELQNNLNNIVKLLNTAHDDIAPVVMAEIKARVEALNAYVENEVLPAVDKAIREAHDYAVAYLRAKVDEAYNAFVAAVEQAYEQYGIAKELICKYLTEKADEIIALIVAHGHGVEEKIANFLWECREEIAALIAKHYDVYGPMVLDILIKTAAEHGLIVAEKVVNFLYENSEKAVALLVKFGEEYGPVALEAMINAFVEYGPEAAEWTYNFLLNNPEKVIAFVSEYGPYAEPYLPYAIAVLGFVWVNFGDEIVDFVIANRCEILTVMVDLVKNYGDEAWALIKVYVEELGLLEKLPTADVMAKLEKLAGLLGKYGFEILEKFNFIEKIETALNEMIASVEHLIDAQVQTVIDRINATIAKIDAMIRGEIEMAEDSLKAALVELDAAVTELVAMLKDRAEELADESAKAAINYFNTVYFNATHGVYGIGEDSYYVAIGDDYVVDYAKLLAEELGLGEKTANVTAGSMADILENVLLPENLLTIANADMITVGYSNTSIFSFAVEQLRLYVGNNPTMEMDWNKAVGEDLNVYVQDYLAQLRAELVAQGLDTVVSVPMTKVSINPAEVIMLLVESYAYAAVDYARNYPALIETIRAINEDALIVSVGMSNTLADIELDMNELFAAQGVEVEAIAFGEYVQYLVDIANNEALAIAMLGSNIVYVDAPEVDLVADEDAYDSVMIFLLEGIMDLQDPSGWLGLTGIGKFENGLKPSEEGNAYIVEQILNALTITEKQPEQPEEPEVPNVMMGDVTGDGKVNVGDAVKMLKAIAAKTTGEFSVEEFTAADVTRDGKINVGDAVKLLKAIASKTTGDL